MWSQLKLHCAAGIGLAAAWKPFPELDCVFRMPAMNRLPLDSRSLIQVDKSVCTGFLFSALCGLASWPGYQQGSPTDDKLEKEYFSIWEG